MPTGEDGRRRYRLLAGAALAMLAAALMLQITAVRAGSVTPDVRQTYFDAIDDARNASQDKISTGLLAIVPGNDAINRARLHGCDIVWEGKPGDSRLLVATFMSRDNYKEHYKKNLDERQPEYILKKSLWVTVVPELQNFFVRKRGGGASAKAACPPAPERIVKLLGLKPGLSYDVLLEFWVDPKVLFRPSADPETTDHESQVTMRNSEGAYVFPAEATPFVKLDDAERFMDASKAVCPACPQWTYRDWFVDRLEHGYEKGDANDPRTWGYPWTRLGYTYDWGDKRKHIGVSEFVVSLIVSQNDATRIVKLNRAIDSAKPEWNKYFRCTPGCTDEGNLDAVESGNVLSN